MNRINEDLLAENRERERKSIKEKEEQEDERNVIL